MPVNHDVSGFQRSQLFQVKVLANIFFFLGLYLASLHICNKSEICFLNDCMQLECTVEDHKNKYFGKVYPPTIRVSRLVSLRVQAAGKNEEDVFYEPELSFCF